VFVLSEDRPDHRPSLLNRGEEVLDVRAADAEDVAYAQTEEALDDVVTDAHHSPSCTTGAYRMRAAGAPSSGFVAQEAREGARGAPPERERLAARGTRSLVARPDAVASSRHWLAIADGAT
jgi:hypothetical protein